MSSKVLTRCQARWAELLSEFHFSITYHPGRLATLRDVLSCWDDVYPERVEDFISKNPMNFQQLIKQDEVQASRYFSVKVDSFSNLIYSIQKALWQDPQYRSILQELGKGKSIQDYSLDFSSKIGWWSQMTPQFSSASFKSVMTLLSLDTLAKRRLSNLSSRIFTGPA
ncbi:hypothetical protein O181_119296 [Austropuccinia psidii MF-1]|uniref:Uncharacterized protein n=1 Tax=Austropuccinia psidii MF-1 TaxID=1389203 RepID=A0A9Q3KG77_9BASI|nr:hypothetical protein [Austropuccinia psidii MF-1]